MVAAALTNIGRACLNHGLRSLRWYWAGLRKAPIFTGGYALGVFVGAMLAQFPALARAALAAVP